MLLLLLYNVVVALVVFCIMLLLLLCNVPVVFGLVAGVGGGSSSHCTGDSYSAGRQGAKN